MYFLILDRFSMEAGQTGATSLKEAIAAYQQKVEHQPEWSHWISVEPNARALYDDDGHLVDAEADSPSLLEQVPDVLWDVKFEPLGLALIMHNLNHKAMVMGEPKL